MDRKFLRPLAATIASLFAASCAHSAPDKTADVITAAQQNGVAGSSLTLTNAVSNGDAATAYGHESHSSHASHASHSSHSSSSF